MFRKTVSAFIFVVFSLSTYAEGSGLKLYVFNCGSIKMPSVEAFGIKDSETDVRELVVPCYIIEHAKGRLLWDGGLPSSVADNDGYDENGGRIDKTFAEQIKALNLNMGSFDFVSFSHFHYDHIGIANEISGAKLIIQKPEYEAAFAEKVTVPYFSPELYSGLKDAEATIIEGDYDVFGDGSVQLISAYGHTPGHQVLYLDLPNYGPLILSGDLYHFRLSRTDRRVPSFNYDAEMSLKAMDKVEGLIVERKAEFWIEHDMALFKTLKTAPAYYD